MSTTEGRTNTTIIYPLDADGGIFRPKYSRNTTVVTYEAILLCTNLLMDFRFRWAEMISIVCYQYNMHFSMHLEMHLYLAICVITDEAICT